MPTDILRVLEQKATAERAESAAILWVPAAMGIVTLLLIIASPDIAAAIYALRLE